MPATSSATRKMLVKKDLNLDQIAHICIPRPRLGRRAHACTCPENDRPGNISILGSMPAMFVQIHILDRTCDATVIGRYIGISLNLPAKIIVCELGTPFRYVAESRGIQSVGKGLAPIPNTL